MSSGERRNLKRAAFAAIAVAALGLGGCIQPLYAPTALSSQGGSIRATLAAIDVPMVPDRMGHTLRNELVFLLEGRDSNAPKRYRCSSPPPKASRPPSSAR